MKIIFLHTLRSIRDNRTQLFVILLTVSLATMLLFATFILKDLFYNIQYAMASRLCGDADIAIEGEIFSESELKTILVDSPCAVQQVDSYTRLTGLMRKDKTDDRETAVQIEATDLAELKERHGDKLFYSDGISQDTVYCYPQAWIDENFAQNAGLSVGDEVEIYISVYDDYCPFTVTYIFEEKGVFANTTMNNVFVDFDSIGNRGLVNTVYIELAEGENSEEMIAFLKSALANDKLSVRNAIDYAYINNLVADNEQLVRIALLFVVTLVFFILTTSYQVIFRKRTIEINIFRASGATSVQYIGILLFEGLFYGIIGSVFGIVIGRLSLQVVALEVIPTFTRAIVYTLSDYVFAFILGVLLSVISALFPVLILAKKTVSSADKTAKKAIPKQWYFLLIPLFLAILACLLVIYLRKEANFVLIFGVILLSVLFVYTGTPLLLEIISKLFLWSKGTARLASSGLYRNKNAIRLTSILSTVIVFSFVIVSLVSVIIDAVKPAGERIRANLITQTISEKTDMSAVNQVIQSTYGVEKSYLYDFRTFTMEADGKTISGTIYAVYDADALDLVTTGLTSAEKEEFIYEDNRIVLSYDLANRLSLQTGDSFELPLDDTKITFTVIAIDNTVTKNDRVCYIMKRKDITFSDTIILSTLKKNVPSADVYKELHEKLISEHCYMMFNEDYNESLSVGINGIALLLRLLQIAVSFVAFIGIINMTVSMQTEREREFMIFYSVGMKRSQKISLAFWESLVIGFSAGIMGTILSLSFNLLLPSLAKIIDRYITPTYFPTEIPFVVVLVMILYSLFYVALTFIRENKTMKTKIG